MAGDRHLAFHGQPVGTATQCAIQEARPVPQMPTAARIGKYIKNFIEPLHWGDPSGHKSGNRATNAWMY